MIDTMESTARLPFKVGEEVAGRSVRMTGNIVEGTAGAVSGGASGLGSRLSRQVFDLDDITMKDKDFVGIQGVILAKMKSLAVPIPETFVISTTATEEFFRNKNSSSLLMKCRKAVGEISRHTGRRFEQTRPNLLSKVTGVAGSDEKRSERPLLLSFRAVPDFPMPDVMETLTSIGMNTDLLNQLAHDKDTAVWAHETYTQFLQTWGTVVEGHDHARFAEIIREVRARAGILQGQPLDLDTLKLVIHEFKRLVNPPEDPVEQLRVAIETICNNWYGSRADKFQDLFGLDRKPRLAIIVQHMVYGNYDNKSGSGVGFSRNPVNGDTDHMAEFLPMATRFELLFQEVEPLHLSHLRNFKPEVFYKMQHVLKLHETNFKDAHLLEFVVESGIFYLVHASNAQRSSHAAIRIAVDMAKNKLISEQEAIMRIEPFHLKNPVERVIDPRLEAIGEGILYRKVGKGIPASSGTVSGMLVFSTMDAIECRRKGVDCILCLPQTSPNDLGGLQAANGVISLLGGVGSTAAVWMRTLCKPAITNVADFAYDVRGKRLISIDSTETLSTGDVVTIDGNTGEFYFGKVPTVSADLNEETKTLLKWAKNYKSLKVYSNIKNVFDAQVAVRNGADGVQLYDTDTLLKSPERMQWLRTILITDSEADRSAALTQVQNSLKSDFVDILRVVRDQDVIIRLLDGSLHDVLPSRDSEDFGEEILSLSNRCNMSIAAVMRRIKELHEPNPVMGIRGCRLLILQPHLLAAQVRAITGATIALNNEGVVIRPRIVLPAAFSDQELQRLIPLAREAITETCVYDFQASTEAKQRSVQCELGVSLEVPRACLRAERFAQVENISFAVINTDELTQLVFGVDKVSSDRIMNMYIERSVLSRNPFECLDTLGVGQLVQLAVNNFKSKNPNIKINVVGEHTGDPVSLRYLDKIGIDEVTALDKHDLPCVMLAAAQARIQPNRMRSVPPTSF